MSKPTPGPWAAEHTLDVGWTVDSVPLRQGYGRVVVADIDSTIDDEETAANARLICAAPDLLEALERILAGQAAEERGEDGGDWFEHWANARAAVAKARGAS